MKFPENYRKGETNPNYKHGQSKTQKYHREYYILNTEKRKIYSDARRKKAREFVDNLKSLPCLDCKVQYAPYVMHFDHRDAALKKFNIGNMVSHQTFKQILEEVQKCDVVCANCHAIRTHNRRLKCAF